MAKLDDKRNLRCSFCGKHQDKVKRLIAGPGVYICDECIALCQELISGEPIEPKSTSFTDPEKSFQRQKK